MNPKLKDEITPTKKILPDDVISALIERYNICVDYICETGGISRFHPFPISDVDAIVGISLMNKALRAHGRPDCDLYGLDINYLPFHPHAHFHLRNGVIFKLTPLETFEILGK